MRIGVLSKYYRLVENLIPLIKIKVMAVSVQFHGWTTRDIKEKKNRLELHKNMLYAILKTILEAEPRKTEAVQPFAPNLANHSNKTIKICWTLCWRSRDELMSDVLRWTSPHGHDSVGRLAKTYITQLWHWVTSRGLTKSDGWEGWVVKLSRKYVLAARDDDRYIYIIIMSRHQRGYPWPFLATLHYRPLLPAGLLEYIPYWYRATVCRF